MSDRQLPPELSRQLAGDIGQRLLINQRKFGRKDPAYIAPSAHDHYMATLAVSRGQKPARIEKWSAEELEAYVRKAPELAALMTRRGVGSDRAFYDDQARLGALWAIEHLEHDESANVLQVDRFWSAVRDTHPQLPDLMLSTAQKEWAHAAAIRVFDSYR